MLEKLFKDKKVCLHNIPTYYQEQFQSFSNKNEGPYDVVFAFVHSFEAMADEIKRATTELKDEGILYLAYPKLKNSRAIPGIHCDHILPYLKVNMDTGYVKDTLMRFNKMVSFDEDYTLLAVKKDTKQKARSATSQRVDDYETFVDEIKVILKNESCLNFYNNLTPGYQKGWARFIFTAKTEETKQKRILEMITLLQKGIKSKDLA